MPLLVDISVLHSFIVGPRFLESNVPKAIPLRAALRIKSQDIVMGTDLIFSAVEPFLEVDDLVFELFSTGDAVVEMIQAEIQL